MSAGSAVVRFFVLVFAVSLMCFSVSAANSELTFFTPEYDIEPDYNDGVLIVDGLLHLMYWENTLAFYLLSPLDLFKDTSLGNFTTNHLYPLLMILLSSLAGVLLFSRKSPDYLSPTAAKVLAFLEEHPVSTEPAIIRGVGKSRGAVSYQLHRLLFDGKIYSAEICGKTCYSTSPSSPMLRRPRFIFCGTADSRQRLSHISARTRGQHERKSPMQFLCLWMVYDII